MSHGYHPNKTDLDTRMNKISGQVRGVAKMISDDRYCIDILAQISAIQGALDKVGMNLLETHVAHCVIGASDESVRDEKTAELLRTIQKMIGKR